MKRFSLLLIWCVGIVAFDSSAFAEIACLEWLKNSAPDEIVRIAITGDSSCFIATSEENSKVAYQSRREKRMQRESIVPIRYSLQKVFGSILTQQKIEVERVYHSIPWAVIRGTAGRLITLSQRYPSIEFHPLQKIVPNRAITRTVKTQFTSSLHSSWEYGESAGQLDALGILTAQLDEGFTGADITIGVLDDGFELNHSCLKNMRLIEMRDFVAGRKYHNVDGYHGTSVLSVMAANSLGRMIGGAPNASYLLAQVFDERNSINDDEASWAAAVEWCEEMGADVIHSSLSFEDPFAKAIGHSLAYAASVEARRRGVLLVSAAGNEGDKLRSITAPGSFRSVLAVGATDSIGSGRDFSGRGPTFDGFAKPDFSAPGANVLVAKPGTKNQLERADGTSFAAPLLTSAIAILWEAHPDWNADQIENALYDAAENFTALNPVTGAGRVWLPDAIAYPFVRGHVLFPNTTSHDHAIVVLLPWGKKQRFENALVYRSDETGDYEFTGIEEGSYLLWVQADGFRFTKQIEVPGSQEIDVIVK